MITMKTNAEINIIDNYEGIKHSPTLEQLHQWTELCLCSKYHHVAINIMLVGLLESQKFNINFRSKNGATNILSFPYEDDTSLVGDLVICSPLVITEAKDLQKSEENHWRHLFVHGMLHLQAYDHQNDTDEKEMVGLEDKIIAAIVNLKEGNQS